MRMYVDVLEIFLGIMGMMSTRNDLVTATSLVTIHGSFSKLSFKFGP